MGFLTAHPLKVRPCQGAYTPRFSDLDHEARSGALKGATPRLLALFPESISHPLGTVSRTPPPPPPPPPPRAHERKRFRPVKASKTFCVLVSPTPTRKKSPGDPSNRKRCGLLCSPMA